MERRFQQGGLQDGIAPAEVLGGVRRLRRVALRQDDVGLPKHRVGQAAMGGCLVALFQVVLAVGAHQHRLPGASPRQYNVAVGGASNMAALALDLRVS